MKDRNFHPTKEARLAMYIYGVEYSQQNLGSMDYYDSLNKERKKFCVECIDYIEHTKTRSNLTD